MTEPIPSRSETALELVSVSRTFPGRPPVEALLPISLGVQAGETVALVGSNGAGKTTLLRIACGGISPTGGAVRLFGDVPHAAVIRSRVGALVGVNLVARRSGLANLHFAAALRGIDAARRDMRIVELSAALDLGSFLRRRVGTYSTGMARRLALAVAMLHDPDVLLLDEPTSGVDGEVARVIRRLIRSRAAAGSAVVIASHQQQEVAELADRVVHLRAGRVETISDATGAR